MTCKVKHDFTQCEAYLKEVTRIKNKILNHLSNDKLKALIKERYQVLIEALADLQFVASIDECSEASKTLNYANMYSYLVASFSKWLEVMLLKENINVKQCGMEVVS